VDEPGRLRLHPQRAAGHGLGHPPRLRPAHAHLPAAWLDARHLHPEASEYVKVLAASRTGMADPAMTPAGDFLGYMMAARPIGMNLVPRSVATVPEPGPIAIPHALEPVLAAHGATVHRNAGVRRMVVEDGRAGRTGRFPTDRSIPAAGPATGWQAPPG
jgi:hypothetical protein